MKNVSVNKLSNKASKNEYQQVSTVIHDSIPVSILFISDDIFSRTDKMIYLHIFTQVTEEGSCYKSNSRLAQDLNINRATISCSIKKCIKLNILSATYQYRNKSGRRTMYFSHSNCKHIISMDNAFRKKNKLPLNKIDKKNTEDNKDCNTDEKNNKRVAKLSKSNDVILSKVVHELSIRSNYQPKPAKRAIISEYYNGNASIQRIKYAFWVALYKSKYGTRPVKSLVGLMCNISNNVDIDTLKIQCHRDYRIMYIKDKQKKEDNESARRLENDGIYF